VKLVFADTLYWIASIAPGDPWRGPTLRALAALDPEFRIVTTEEVLTEVLSGCASLGPYWRGAAVHAIEAAQTSINVAVLPQSHLTFTAGLDLYANRPDKAYSLVDCISMCAMRDHEITDILTNDHHFTQEGFNILINP
jgi:uncharacterized protein